MFERVWHDWGGFFFCVWGELVIDGYRVFMGNVWVP